jgi:putative DNA methylase
MRKKMIEVAIPLDAINRESAREKAIRHGHPSTLHLWWARRPLAACRAVLFASFVDDPDSDPANWDASGSVIPEKASLRRAELFRLIEDLVRWENSNNASVLDRARAEIACSYATFKVHESKEWTLDKVVAGSPVQEYLNRTASPASVRKMILECVPTLHDPFAGGGSIPLEAQRLGLRARGTDLNPLPVLLNKALIEFPPLFSDREPISTRFRPIPSSDTPKARQKTLAGRSWSGTQGLAEDIRYYGSWMRDEAFKRVGHLYPRVLITPAMAKDRPDLAQYVREELTVIAWLWARTVRSPNPAAEGAHVPLVRSFWLSTKKGKRAYFQPKVTGSPQQVEFSCVTEAAANGSFDVPTATIGRTGGHCLITNSPISLEYIRDEGRAKRLGHVLTAIVAEGKKERVFLPPIEAHGCQPPASEISGVPDTDLPTEALGFRVQNYGMTKHRDLFMPRQLATLATLCDLVRDAHKRVLEDSGGDKAYADAIATYLAFAIGKSADYWTALAAWQPDEKNLRVGHLFTRHAIAMTWDYGESNPFGETTANFTDTVGWIAKAVERLPSEGCGVAAQVSASSLATTEPCVVSTDPPYYDNVPYADLSDFFYVWLRRCLLDIHPSLFGTVLVPKSEELIADPFRHGGREAARKFFERGMHEVFERLLQKCVPEVPATIFYAFKQTEGDEDADSDEESDADVRASTGWETFLQGLTDASWQIVGTWPMRTELGNRMRSMGSNALASSIILVVRPRRVDAPMTSRKEFVAALRRELPSALRELQGGNIAPVDLAQAAIGPGMAVYSRYSKVLESSGERLTVRTALALINQVLDEVLAEQEGDYDADTRWSLKWFEQFAHDDGPFGDANTLATAMSIGINGLVETGIVQAKSGKVRLLQRSELMGGHPETWDPATDTDIVHWEVCQYLIHALDSKGEAGAAALLQRINARYPGAAETARELAYRLYTVCERKKWAQEAMAYNSLIVAWPEIVKLAQSSASSGVEAQTTMF